MIIKSFRIFESSLNIDEICKKYYIENYNVGKDGKVNVQGDVYFISNHDLDTLPLSFGEVSGNFSCFNNQISSFLRFPTYVGMHFDCSKNKITSFRGRPEYVGGFFDCSHNNFNSLRGITTQMGSQVDKSMLKCNYSHLISLNGCPPVQLIGCANNQLTSFEGISKNVLSIVCYHNHIYSFEGLENHGFQDIRCDHNPIYDIYSLNKKPEFIEFLLEHDVIREGNKVSKLRLVQALEDSGFEETSNIESYVLAKFKFLRNYELTN